MERVYFKEVVKRINNLRSREVGCGVVDQKKRSRGISVACRTTSQLKKIVRGEEIACY
jgi:hypothetical protein